MIYRTEYIELNTRIRRYNVSENPHIVDVCMHGGAIVRRCRVADICIVILFPRLLKMN